MKEQIKISSIKELKTITERFGLTDVIRNKLRQLKPGERMAVQLARVSMQDADLIYLEEPLLNLDSDRTGRAAPAPGAVLFQRDEFRGESSSKNNASKPNDEAVL